MQESFDITTLIFLALAAFVIWRLRSVLGQKTGNEQPPPFDPLARRDQPAAQPRNGPLAGSDNVVRLPGGINDRTSSGEKADRWGDIAAAGTPIAQGLDAVSKIEPSFDAYAFLEGAKTAYEMIVTAFARGDRTVLKDLLAKDVYEGFEKAVVEREKRGEKVETTFVSIDKAEITGVDVRGNNAQITVRFLSKLITATRDAGGKVVDGDAEAIVDVTDMWTFARTLGSHDPSWALVATEASQ